MRTINSIKYVFAVTLTKSKSPHFLLFKNQVDLSDAAVCSYFRRDKTDISKAFLRVTVYDFPMRATM